MGDWAAKGLMKVREWWKRGGDGDGDGVGIEDGMLAGIMRDGGPEMDGDNG